MFVILVTELAVGKRISVRFKTLVLHVRSPGGRLSCFHALLFQCEDPSCFFRLTRAVHDGMYVWICLSRLLHLAFIDRLTLRSFHFEE